MSEIRFEEEEFTSQANVGTLLRILGLLRNHWKWVVGFILAIFLVSFLDSAFTFISKLIIDEGIIAGDYRRLLELVVFYASLIAVQAFGVFCFIALTGILGQRVQYDLRARIFNHLQRLSFSYFDRTPVGWIMSRLTSDTQRIAELVSWGLLDVTWALVNILTALTFMLTINWKLTLIVAAIIPILVYVAAWFKKRILVEYRLARKLNSEITGQYNENITGVRVTQAFNRQERNLDEFAELTADMQHASYRAAWYSALFLPSVQLISALAIGSVLWFSGVNVSAGEMTIGGIQAFVSYIIFMIWPVQDLARVYASMQHAIASAERSFSLLDTAPEIVNRADAVDPGTIIGDIEFDHVTFYYEPDKPVLQDFNLHVRAGETIALVGETGGGKSTIVNLLCRFYEPKEGRIRIGGRDYTQLKLEAIHSRIGVVLQTPHLFSGTIRENIRYGRLDATDEEVEEAARLAGAHDFIMAFENGYEEQVGEGGVLLSVGEKQLISLARAILARPEIFIMDEATSSVDTITEGLIQQGMERLMEGRTSFIIAHRLSTIKRADRILVISKGRIIEQGTHEELLRQGGHYYALYTKQFRNEMERELAAQSDGATA